VSYGKNSLTAPNVTFDNIVTSTNDNPDAPTITTTASGFIGSTVDAEFADVALFYTADWNSIKVSASYAYTWIETGAITGSEVDLHQVGASIMHKPSGLGIYAMGQWEQPDGRVVAGLEPVVVGFGAPADGNGPNFNPDDVNGVIFGSGFGGPVAVRNTPDTDAWYVKPFWRKAWSPIGATVLYGEYGQYNDQFAAGKNFCLAGGMPAASAIGSFCATQVFELNGDDDTWFQAGGVFVDSSEVERWGLGVVQEIDSAAMHLWARWQHQTLSASFIGYDVSNGGDVDGCFDEGNNCQVSTRRIRQSFDDWDLFQVGGIIFF
jgi:hypothetical protein